MNVPKYPCLLCGESFYSKVSYEMHFYDCIKETSNKMTTAEKQIFEANEKFFLNGEEEFKLQAEQNRNYYDDLKYRLGLYGYQRCGNGCISPMFSKFFATAFCGYCNDGFIEMDDLLKHKEDCKKTALNLKSTLHQATKYLEGQLVSSPENHLLEDEWRRMKECLALVSYKLLINEQIKLNDFSM